MELKTHSIWQRLYGDYYAGADSGWRTLTAIDKARNIQILCQGIPLRSVLEIGAGEGSVLERLSELRLAADLYALEISPSGVAAIAERRIPNLKGCSLFDGYEIPYADGTFDLAVLSHVLEHVEYPRALLYEAGRVARYVFVEVPLEDTMRLPADFELDGVGHINFYSPTTIRRLLQTCGLRVLGQRTTNPSKAAYRFRMGRRGLINFYVKEYLLRIFPALATALFTYHASLLCESDHDVP